MIAYSNDFHYFSTSMQYILKKKLYDYKFDFTRLNIKRRNWKN